MTSTLGSRAALVSLAGSTRRARPVSLSMPHLNGSGEVCCCKPFSERSTASRGERKGDQRRNHAR